MRTGRGPGPTRGRAARRAQGKALRRKCPRRAHAHWGPPPGRPDPIDLLREADAGRIAELLPIRYERMSASPFGFLRGASAVMASDLSRTPTSGLRVQMCGDAHLANFGVFATPERNEVFDANDFDETLPGPWEWDVKRLAVSLAVLARQNGLPRSVARRIAVRSVRAYRRSILGFAGDRYLDVWYSHIDPKSVPGPVDARGRRLVREAAGAARRRTALRSLPRVDPVRGGGHRIRDDPPLLEHPADPSETEAARRGFERYVASLPEERRRLLERFEVADVARKVVGVGSVGTPCHVMLLVADPDRPEPLFLQWKEARASVYEPFAGPSPYESHAQRVVVGQRLVQEASDIFLGWSRLGTRDFYVRQLRDMKFTADTGAMGAAGLAGAGEVCAASLARSHARTGDMAALAGYLGAGDGIERAIGEFAVRYSRQVERDHAAMVTALRLGRLPGSATGRRRRAA